MTHITTEMITCTDGDIASFKVHVPINSHLAINFFSDENINMVMINNSVKDHIEYHMESKEFDIFLEKFIDSYLTLLEQQAVVSLPVGTGNLFFCRLNGIITIKGCLSESCKGIQLFLDVKDCWNKKKALLKKAYKMGLNFG